MVFCLNIEPAAPKLRQSQYSKPVDNTSTRMDNFVMNDGIPVPLWRNVRKRISYSLLAGSAAFAIAVQSVHAGAADPLPVPAQRSADFLAILGVNGHIGSNVKPYLDAAGIVADSQYIGIRHWRDMLTAQAPWQIGPLQALTRAGIGLIGVPLQNQAITVADHIAKARAWAALAPNALYALEGPNEPGNFPFSYNGTNVGNPGKPKTFMPVAEFQRDYYSAIKSDPVLREIPVWSVTLGGAAPDNFGLQYLTVPTPRPSGVLMPANTTYADTYADVANIHSYPMYDKGAQAIDQTADRYKITYYNNFVKTYSKGFPGYSPLQADVLPKVITEFGYPATGGTPGGITVDIPTQGKNILTGLFNAWVGGYHHVGIYDLYELGDGYGLFYGTGRPKVSATYLHNLTSTLSDTGDDARSFAPGTLTYSLTGLPATAKSTLFQKSSGKFNLIIWNNVANWNMVAGSPIEISSTNVTVMLSVTANSIRVYDPTRGSAPVQSSENARSIALSLSDYPLVVEIDPGGVCSADVRAAVE